MGFENILTSLGINGMHVYIRLNQKRMRFQMRLRDVFTLKQETVHKLSLIQKSNSLKSMKIRMKQASFRKLKMN